MSLEYLVKVLSDSLGRGDISEQKKAIKNHYIDLREQKQKIVKDISLPDELIRLFEVSAEFMFIKDYRKGIYQQSYVAMDKVIAELAKRINLSIKEIKLMVLEEIEAALLNGEAEKYQSLAKLRTELCCAYSKSGQIKIYEGETCKSMIEKLTPKPITEEDLSKITEVKGTVAYRGEVSGIVKIVLVVEDIDKVNEGDILVSSATNPDLILAMKKAAAFVTDMGGITSHASIVAREMKKPCVVGTKNATHVFKDGDKVFVDAINGIVKKVYDNK